MSGTSSLVRRLRTLSGAIAVVVLALAACNSGPKSSPTAANSSVQIVGAGSSFVYPLMTRWISDFQATHSDVQINYQSIGSGDGMEQLKNGLVDFAASDAVLDDEQLKTMPAVVQIPESAGPVCLTYNLPQLKAPLRLSSETLVAVYLGKIKNWQDAAIKRVNPGVALPNQSIVPAHRSDGSGTTNIFSTYLAKVSPQWRKQVGQGISLSWPVGLGGKGNEGVSGIVKETPGAIGYIELAYATQNHLPVALVRNKAGRWIEPGVASTTAAIEAFSRELDKDVRTPIVDPPASAKDAYPIAGLTFLIVPKEGKTAARARVVENFVQYVVSQGQDESEKLSYAKLPAALQKGDETLLAQLKGQNNQAAMIQK
jgi:phosphate transport system substrate-binding protein